MDKRMNRFKLCDLRFYPFLRNDAGGDFNGRQRSQSLGTAELPQEDEGCALLAAGALQPSIPRTNRIIATRRPAYPDRENAMCLSTVYMNSGNEQKQIMKDIARIEAENQT